MTRTAGYTSKQRNSYRRKRKSIVLLGTEGKNKTETIYFRSVQSSNYVVQFAPGNYTDPVNIVPSLEQEYKELELDANLGDVAFCLVDSDVNPAKDKQMKKADTETDKVTMLVSSPCFEVWYLCHFTASSHQYASNDEVLKALKKHIPNYKKGMSEIWSTIGDKTKDAVKHAKQLEKICLSKKLKKHTVSFTPSTEIYKVVELICK